MNTIDSFDGQYAFLSNFYNCTISYDNITYRNAETAFQAQKSLNIHVREELAHAGLTPGQAKRVGRGQAFTSIDGERLKLVFRLDWELVKNSVMYGVVRAKFEQNIGLKEKLLITGDAQLIEGNHWHDNYWGQCTCSRCINTVGFNQLGKTLMRVRAELGGAAYNEEWHVDYVGVIKEKRGLIGSPDIIKQSVRYEKPTAALTEHTLSNGVLNSPLVPPCSRH